MNTKLLVAVGALASGVWAASAAAQAPADREAVRLALQAARLMADSVFAGKLIAIDSVFADTSRLPRVHPAATLTALRGSHPRIVAVADYSATVRACRQQKGDCRFPGFDVVLQVGLPRTFGNDLAVPVAYSEVGEDPHVPDPASGGVAVARRAYHYAGLVIFRKDSAGRWQAIKWFATEFD